MTSRPSTWKRPIALATALACGPVIVLAQPPPPTVTELKAKLEQRLQEISAHIDGVAGYEILDLTSGERITHLERAVFPTASTIKLAIVYELFKQVEEGKLRLDEKITLDRAKAVGGSGVLF